MPEDFGQTQTHRVPPGAGAERLDRYAAGIFPRLTSRKQAWKAVRRGELCVNQQYAVPNRPVAPGDVLSYRAPVRCGKIFALDLEVVYEDDSLAVVRKPAGFPVSGNAFRTIENALPRSLAPSASDDALSRPRPVHRLDASTTGLLLVAKRMCTLAALGRQFEQQAVRKRYRGIVVGRLQGRGTIDEPIDGRAALTEYRAVEHTPSVHTDWITTLDLFPKTGRTHQLRRHLAGLGHALAGDRLYGEYGAVYRGKGLFLAAVGLEFRHPETANTLTVRIPEPSKFESYRRREARRWKRRSPGK